MLNELQTAVVAYRKKWRRLIDERQDDAFFTALKPTAVGWKVQDLDDYSKWCDELRDISEQVHYGWVNERWLATFVLRQPLDVWGLQVVKIYQRRPGSTDAVGLDHLDFLLPAESNAKAKLTKESDLKWTEETNGERCKWLSIWFDDTEAKLRSDSVLQICADEMLEYQSRVFGL